jgi:hypothetical protein
MRGTVASVAVVFLLSLLALCPLPACAMALAHQGCCHKSQTLPQCPIPTLQDCPYFILEKGKTAPSVASFCTSSLPAHHFGFECAGSFLHHSDRSENAGFGGLVSSRASTPDLKATYRKLLSGEACFLHRQCHLAAVAKVIQENRYEEANDGCSEPGGSRDIDVRKFLREVGEGGMLQWIVLLPQRCVLLPEVSSTTKSGTGASGSRFRINTQW